MVEQNQAERKKATEKAESDAEEKRQDEALEKQKKDEADRIAAEQKAIEDEKKADAKAKEKEEKSHSLVVVDVGIYVGKISVEQCHGVERRLAGIRLMFEELGTENYVERVTYKGTEAFVFKK